MYNRNYDAVPSLSGYYSAKRYHDSIKPLRTTGIRHIGKRSSDNAMVVHMDREVVHFKLHSTNCVSFFPDGTIELNHGGWETVSTTMFMHSIAPFSVRREQNRVRVGVSGGSYAIPREGLRIKDGVVLNPETEFNYVLNKDRAKEVRARLKPVFDRAKAIMSATTPSSGLYADTPAIAAAGIAQHIKNGKNEDDVLMYILKKSLGGTYLMGWGRQAYWSNAVFENVRWAAYDQFDAFDKVPVPAGELPKKRRAS